MEKHLFLLHSTSVGVDPTAQPSQEDLSEGCSLVHRRVQIRAFQPESDLLSTHIGNRSKVKCAKLTNNGYYNGYYGTTGVVPGFGAHHE